MVWVVLGTVGIVLAMIGVGLLIDRRWALLPRPEPTPELPAGPPPTTSAPGETAATAVRGDACARGRLVADQRCCGAAMTETDDEQLVYDGHGIVVIRLRCATCGATRSVYVDPT